MGWLAHIREALHALFRKQRADDELDEELRFHLDMEIEKNVRAGMSREEARRVAYVRFGGVEGVKEQVREERGARPLEDLLQDLRYAGRQLRRNRGFAIVAVLTLALGVGANTAVFSVMQKVVLSPLGYHEADRLVRVYQTMPGRPHEGAWVSGAAFLDYRDQLESLESVTALYNYRENGFNLTGFGPPQRVTMLRVSSDFFDVYRARPVFGRGFYREEERGSARVVVLSDRLWRSLGGDASILGERLILDDNAYEVIGVMPADFIDVVGGDVDLWIPLELQDQNATQNRGNHYLSLVGRLASGVSHEEAQARIEALSRSQAELYPMSHDGWSARIDPLHDDLVGGASLALYLLLGASGLVLLIACVNVASLVISRNVARERELAVRTALGAGRFRLVRQLLAESLVIAVIGGVAGFLLARWGVSALLPLAADALPRAGEVSLDSLVFAFALAVAVLTVMAFGLAPALQSARPDLDLSLRDNPRTSTGGARSARARTVLITSQIALALVLLVGAGLLTRSLFKLQRVDLGLGSENVMTFEVHLGGQGYTEASARIDLHRNFQARLQARSAVEAAGAVSKLPVSDVYNSWTFTYVSETGEVLEHEGYADIRVVEGEYFEAMGIPALHGRLFDRTDDSDSDLVAMINESTARRFFDGRDPLGEPIILGRRSFRIVGVVVDVAHDHRGSSTPKVYLPHTQFGDDRNWALSQVAATDLPRRDFTAIAREELAAVDPALVVHNVRSLSEIKAAAMARERFVFLLFGVFAAVALLLAAVGLYGVMAYNVGRRSREFGIRQAMGADGRTIRRSVFRHAAVTVGVGIAIGLAVAFALSRLLGALLFEVSATDPLTFAVVSLVLALAGFAASYIPARRATRVDPVEVLRYE